LEQLPPNMTTYAVRAAQAAWESHFADCPDCQQAASIRDACEESKRLHEAWVVAAHEAHKAMRS
jgi:hypothetical protein